MDTWIQGYSDEEVKRVMDTGIHRWYKWIQGIHGYRVYMDTGIKGYMDTRIHGYRVYMFAGIQGIHGYRVYIDIGIKG